MTSNSWIFTCAAVALSAASWSCAGPRLEHPQLGPSCRAALADQRQPRIDPGTISTFRADRVAAACGLPNPRAGGGLARPANVATLRDVRTWSGPDQRCPYDAAPDARGRTASDYYRLVIEPVQDRLHHAVGDPSTLELDVAALVVKGCGGDDQVVDEYLNKSHEAGYSWARPEWSVDLH